MIKDGYIKMCNDECKKGIPEGYCLVYCEFKYNKVSTNKKEVITDD